MTDEELLEKVAQAIRGTPPVPPWEALNDGQRRAWLDDADRAIALCREHYGGKIERLRRERDEAMKVISLYEEGGPTNRRFNEMLRALRKEEGDD